ncbi:fibronectin type III domain-containing protein [Paenibacillus taiwanensis]|uniref:fibronectin type III domain-containing protein n=1 Tax=Paenibacillus taiwanensis TaxID=401638 RepID=UPI000427F908|nr:fibronectin type III domain-containing protein [Paenibacillus taiwanensis]
MKKFSLSLFFVTLFTFISIASVQAAPSKYTDGLLDNVPIQIGAKVGQPSINDMTQMTDGDPTTIGYLRSQLAWHTFASPQNITSVMMYGNKSAVIEFFDANNKFIDSYKTLNINGIETLPKVAENVSMVVLKGDSYTAVYEWNVFSSPSVAPNPTTINWIQGGDKSVYLEWDNTGAKSYNVKRHTSSGGPFTTVGSVSGTSYTEKVPTNGISYFYVVSAVNEAGESPNSPERSIKPDATKYTGGLLDGIALSVGHDVKQPLRKAREITDNNANTYQYMNQQLGSMTWHSFADPVDISSVILSTSVPKATIEFYNKENGLIDTYKSLSIDGMQSLPKIMKDVSSVVLKLDSNGRVDEWNVFSSPSVAPNPTTISWIHGGDKIVYLEWADTGAKTYNVKRATSKSGPYAPLVSGLSGTSYYDKSVTNGTTYYYVVSSLNEAGESTNSPERSIKPDATKYTGGLLDGLALNVGKDVAKSLLMTREMTDNNTTSGQYLNASIGTLAWYSFNNPVEVTSSILNSTDIKATMEFYDDKNNLVYSHHPVENDKLETLPNKVEKVKMVVLKANSAMKITEWNVFGKAIEQPVPAPLHLTAKAGDSKVVLNWNVVSNAGSYNLKRSTTAGGPYTTIATVTGSTYSYLDTAVSNGTTYYYVVTAVNTAGESGNSNEASATPKTEVVTPPGPGGEEQAGNRAILRLVLNNSIEKEYDLSMAEVNAFITWYEVRATGKGSVMYAIDKHNNNKGPFKNRKDYVFFDKIITFEVNGYDTADSSGGNSSETSNGGNQTDPNPEEY